MYYIYLIVNKVNGKTYVGQRKSSKEWYEGKYMGSGKYLKASQKKYGIENFEKFLIQYCYSKEETNKAERFWIAEYRSRGKAEYNIAYGGTGGNLGEEVARLISEKLKGNQNHKGKRHTEDAKKKMSEAAKGRQSYWRGKHLTEEAKRKSSESHKGKHLTEEQKRKISESNRGKRHSEESIQKMSESKKGHKVSEETRKKISETNRGKHWYNNGEISIQAKECPEGFVKGRICKLIYGKKVYH